jgi:MFS family permease
MNQKTNYISTRRKSISIGWLVCMLGALFYCYEYLLRIEPSVIVPELMREFNITAANLGLIAAVYYFTYTPMQVVVGILIDRYGARLVLTCAVTACTLGSFLFSTSESIYVVGFGRLLIGFGSAFAFVGVMKLAAEWLPKHHFAMFAGFTVSLAMVGAMVGDMELTLLIHKIGWKSALYIGTVIGVVLIPMIWILVRDTPKWKESHSGKTSFRETFIGLKQIIKNPQMWISGIIGCAFFLSLSVFAELWGIPFLRNVYKLSPSVAAFACSMVFAGWLVGAPINGWLSDKNRTRKLPLIVGGSISAIIITIIVFRPINISIEFLDVLLFLFGIFSSVQIVCFAISKENNPTHVAATAVAFTNLLIMTGALVFQPLIGKLLDIRWIGHVHKGVRVYSAINYQHALLILPISIVIGVILSFILRETFGRGDWDEFDVE